MSETSNVSKCQMIRFTNLQKRHGSTWRDQKWKTPMNPKSVLKDPDLIHVLWSALITLSKNKSKWLMVSLRIVSRSSPDCCSCSRHRQWRLMVSLMHLPASKILNHSNLMSPLMLLMIAACWLTTWSICPSTWALTTSRRHAFFGIFCWPQVTINLEPRVLESVKFIAPDSLWQSDARSEDLSSEKSLNVSLMFHTESSSTLTREQESDCVLHDIWITVVWAERKEYRVRVKEGKLMSRRWAAKRDRTSRISGEKEFPYFPNSAFRWFLYTDTHSSHFLLPSGHFLSHSYTSCLHGQPAINRSLLLFFHTVGK